MGNEQSSARRIGRPPAPKPASLAEMALAPEFFAALAVISPCQEAAHTVHLSARKLWEYLGGKYKFPDWIAYRETQRVRRAPNLGRLDARLVTRSNPNPAGGRPFQDYLVTPEQARYLAEIDSNPKAVLLLQALDLRTAPSDAPSVPVPVRTAYTAGEFVALLGDVDGYPASERGWRMRLLREKRARDGRRFEATPDEVTAIAERVARDL